jgi:hypothetical protein
MVRSPPTDGAALVATTAGAEPLRVGWARQRNRINTPEPASKVELAAGLLRALGSAEFCSPQRSKCAATIAICDEFEACGYRRVGAELRHRDALQVRETGSRRMTDAQIAERWRATGSQIRSRLPLSCNSSESRGNIAFLHFVIPDTTQRTGESFLDIKVASDQGRSGDRARASAQDRHPWRRLSNAGRYLYPRLHPCQRPCPCAFGRVALLACWWCLTDA